MSAKAGIPSTIIEKNVDGLTVNRWLSTGMLAASASSLGAVLFLAGVHDTLRNGLID